MRERVGAGCDFAGAYVSATIGRVYDPTAAIGDFGRCGSLSRSRPQECRKPIFWAAMSSASDPDASKLDLGARGEGVPSFTRAADDPRLLRRFVLSLLAATVGLLVAVLSLNILIDPFDLFHTGLVPTAIENDRAIKIGLLDSLKASPDILILGSSRSRHAQPAFLQQLTGRTGFNAGVTGGDATDEWVFTHSSVASPPVTPALIRYDPSLQEGRLGVARSRAAQDQDIGAGLQTCRRAGGDRAVVLDIHHGCRPVWNRSNGSFGCSARAPQPASQRLQPGGRIAAAARIVRCPGEGGHAFSASPKSSFQKWPDPRQTTWLPRISAWATPEARDRLSDPAGSKMPNRRRSGEDSADRAADAVAPPRRRTLRRHAQRRCPVESLAMSVALIGVWSMNTGAWRRAG